MWISDDPNEGWVVHLAVPADDGLKIIRDPDEHAPPDGLVSLLAPDDEDAYELVIYSREEDKERARNAAIDVYYRRRRKVGLDEAPARVIALTRPVDYAPHGAPAPEVARSYALMKEAERVLDQESNFEWVVVLAQSACEVGVSDILDRWVDREGGAIGHLVKQMPVRNLANRHVRTAFHAITGYTPADQGWFKWEDYTDHVQRRHQIVHAGARITRPEAEKSLQVAKDFIAWLAWPATDGRLYGPKPPPPPEPYVG